VIISLSDDALRIGREIDGLDLEPIVFRLISPEPGEPGMTLAEADDLIARYRCYLKLCAWFPGEQIVPSADIDRAWHAHILDTEKYAADCDRVLGYFLHHFPYLGMRGEDDTRNWHAAYEATRELFAVYFGVSMSGDARSCRDCGGHCIAGPGKCNVTPLPPPPKPGKSLAQARPRPDRSQGAA
jgi:hypothetical protein